MKRPKTGGFNRGSFLPRVVSVDIGASLSYWLPLSWRNSDVSVISTKACQRGGLIFRINENLSSNLKGLIGLFLKLRFGIFKPRVEVQTRV